MRSVLTTLFSSSLGSATRHSADNQGRGSRYGPTANSMPLSNSTSLSPTTSGAGEKERFGQDANMWTGGFEGMNPEADDYLHNPDPKRDHKVCLSFGFIILS